MDAAKQTQGRAKKAPTAAEKAKWDEERKAKIEEAQAAIAHGVESLVTDADWIATLDRVAEGARRKLSPGRYSFGNQMLVFVNGCERGIDTSMVATFKTWERYGRRVSKGAKAMTILQPKVAKWSREVETDAGTETREGKRIFFRTLPVFGYSQTEGEPIEETPQIVPDVATPEGFALCAQKLREVALGLEGSPVTKLSIRARAAGDHPGAGGWYCQSTKEIVVIEHASHAHVVQVLVHEVAHSLLHPLGDPHGSPEREVEAESTAYVVCRVLGLDTAGTSFPYVATWAKRDEKSKASVLSVGERVRKAAQTILDAILGEVEDAAPASDSEGGV